MLSKFKLVDILIKCWNEHTAPLILDLVMNACLTDCFNTRYTHFIQNLVKSSELMCMILSQFEQGNESQKIQVLEVFAAILQKPQNDETSQW